MNSTYFEPSSFGPVKVHSCTTVGRPLNIFLDVLNEKPSRELRQEIVWHIGNIHLVDNSGGSFAIGRTTRRTVSKYVADTGDFIEELFEESPYTICLYDTSIGFVAIARKTKLAPTTHGIARQLARLLDATDAVRQNEIDVAVDPISDPEHFIAKLRDSYSIKSFTAEFTGPNPIDADEVFQKPLSVYCQAVNGKEGKVSVQGDDLDSESLIEVAKSTAAIGNDAIARVFEKRGQRPVRIHLRGDPVKKAYDEEQFEDAQALKDMRAEYRRVRD